MRRSSFGVCIGLSVGLILVSTLLGCSGSAAPADQPPRRLAFEYRVAIPADPARSEAMHLFIPIAVEDEAQKVLSLEIDSPVAGEIETESDYGNRFWHGVVPPSPESPIELVFRYEIERRVVRADRKSKGLSRRKGDPSRFLSSSERVVVSHPILDPILEEIRSASKGGSHETKARAIYDWVVDNVEYKKVGTGWGNGDTFWACNERYGNCTDFHSLFISLARTEGIPASFEMGFPVPLDRAAGRIAGYHCWVEFWMPETGWLPIDASEASKRPELRELYYGSHPADRLHFSTGRDLRLGAAHRGRVLNYFVYPYAEVGGEAVETPISSTFSFREIPVEE